mgnify:CR=1 FL=1
MAAILNLLSEDVQRFVAKKQAQYRIKKKRYVSVHQTIDFLLKEAYLTKPKKVAAAEECDATNV